MQNPSETSFRPTVPVQPVDPRGSESNIRSGLQMTGQTLSLSPSTGKERKSLCDVVTYAIEQPGKSATVDVLLIL